MRQGFFIPGVFLAIVLAFSWSEAAGSYFFSLLGDLAVASIFLVQGLALATRQMVSGIFPLRLHGFVLGWNFLVYPLLAVLILVPFSFLLPAEFFTGIIMLAVLPSTIASATAFTAAAHGAVPQSIFSSILSNLSAIVIVPLILLLYFGTGRGLEVSVIPVLEKLFLIVVLPLMIGQFFQLFQRERATALGRSMKWLPEWAILYIVYLAFAESFLSGSFRALDTVQLVSVFFVLCFLLVCITILVWYSSGLLKLSKEERIAAFFSASQKSIATGLPLLASFFKASGLPPEIYALLIIPLIIYHPLQLVWAGLLLSRLRRNR